MSALVWINSIRGFAGFCGCRRRPRRRDNFPSRQILPSKRYINGLSGYSTYSPREYPHWSWAARERRTGFAPLFFCPCHQVAGESPDTFTLRPSAVMLVARPKGKSINSDGAFPWVP